MFQKYNLRDYNFQLLILVTAAMIFGVVVINSADSSFTSKQILGIAVSLIIMVVLSFIDYHFICKFYIPLYILNLVLLAAVLLFGKTVNNATRWFKLGSIQFQPSELTKVIMIVFTATLLHKLKEKEKLNSFVGIILFAVSLAVPILFIFRQPDLSTTICIVMVLCTMYYIAGLSYKIIGLILLICIPLVGTFVWYIQQPDQKLLYPHQVNRIMSFIYPSQYGDVSAQQDNSVMAIGSGELQGKGLNTSTIATVKEANLISEQQTDFIFSVIGEELGFIGSVFIIAILLLIVLQCIRVARRCIDTEGMLIASGVGCLIGYQSFINISVATALLPNTGIPLPFISYGLSSLMSTAIGIGMVLNVSLQRRKY